MKRQSRFQLSASDFEILTKKQEILGWSLCKYFHNYYVKQLIILCNIIHNFNYIETVLLIIIPIEII